MVIFGRNRHIAIPAMTGVRVHSHHGGASGNGLLNALIAYWPGDETSGDILDAHTNGLDLTDTNTVTYDTGKVYTYARKYTSVNNEYHTRAGDDALLSTGDVDFTFAAWVYLTNISAERDILSKWNFSAGQREYLLRYVSTSSRFQFLVNSTGSASSVVVEDTHLGAPSLYTWYLVVAWHDSVTDTINIQIDNDTADSAAYSSGVFDGTSAFQISGMNGATNSFDGWIGPTAFWKSAAGSGGVLTAAQRTALYNSGNGLAYASFAT